MRPFTLVALSCSLISLSLAGCGGDDTPPGSDGGRDGGSRVDGSTGTDGSTGMDGSTRMDGSTGADGAIDDAGAFDGAVTACADDSTCAADVEYCAKPRCEAAMGGCVTRPTVCPDVVDPVCGCDGSTYGNSCEAAAAGQNIASLGACPTATDGGTPDAGPGGCTSNTDCATTDYCLLPAGACGGVGRCAVRRTICPDVVDPVCGCDGTTYGNSCEASTAGANIRARGACGAVGCAMTPARGCCFDDADCSASTVGRATRCEGAMCVAGDEGVCVGTTIAPGRCWNDGDCARGETCVGERICPCGALCIVADAPGRCM